MQLLWLVNYIYSTLCKFCMIKWRPSLISELHHALMNVLEINMIKMTLRDIE